MNHRFNIGVIGALIIFCAAVFSKDGAYATDTVAIDISRTMRSIMHDGFLMEWSDRSSRPWGSETSFWLFDAAATPNGLAGYLRSKSAPKCSQWEIVFSGTMVDQPCTIQLPHDSSWHCDYLISDRPSCDSSGAYVVEWLFPWPKLRHEHAGPFTLILHGHCKGYDTLPTLIIRGIYPERKAGAMGQLAGRIILIGILAAMYFMVQKRIRRQSRQMESPR